MNKGKASRKTAMKMYNHLYSIALYFNRDLCAYCNEGSTCFDHSPAISKCDKIYKKIFKELGFQFLKIPACTACNSKLSDRNLIGYTERLDFLLTDLDKSLSKTELWSEEELDELGDMMRAYVEAKQFQNNTSVRRLNSMILNMEKVYNGEIIEEMLLSSKSIVEAAIKNGYFTKISDSE